MAAHDPKKIRVLFGINDFLVGGAQMLLSEQFKHLSRNEFEICLVVLKDFANKATLYDRLPKDIPVYTIGFKSAYDLAAWKRLFLIVNKWKPQVVVSHLFFSNTVFRLLSPLFTYKTITVEHNTYIHKKKIEILADRFLAHRSYRIVAVSASVAKFAAAQARIAFNRFVIIRNGIDVSVFGDDGKSQAYYREHLGLPQGRMFLTLSRLVSQKDHETLVRGFSTYISLGHPGFLVIVGDGPLRESLVQLAKAGAEGNHILFPGLRSDVHDWYQAADIFVSTSIIEGFSYAHLEAAASGLPLVSTPTAGADELIQEGKSGWFIPYQNPDALAHTLAGITDQQIEEYGTCSRERAVTFDIRNNVQQYASLLRAATT